jgi:hypothetical protein
MPCPSPRKIDLGRVEENDEGVEGAFVREMNIAELTTSVPHLGSSTRCNSYVNPRSSANFSRRSMQNPEQHWASVAFFVPFKLKEEEKKKSIHVRGRQVTKSSRDTYTPLEEKTHFI